ncbi:dihydroneopterin aldolase [bacterium]|nr:dihydroneopterin aldolase [bacterium]
MDEIYIQDIKASCIIGTTEQERRNKQDVVINVTLHADLREAGLADNLGKTVDYEAVEHKIVGLVGKSSRHLIEALAEDIAQVCLGFDMVEKVDVSVAKPAALKFARTVSVKISREL